MATSNDPIYFQGTRNRTIGVTASEFKGRDYLDVRYYFFSAKDGELRPTKQGVTVPAAEFERFAASVLALTAGSTKA
tara:strand:+ start:777 stop:1007 length:231 start_codon:yes stop_codon:yes gene_type:complete